MPFTISSTPGELILKLEGAVTISDAQDLANSLAGSLEEDTPLGVDTEGLDDIDTCILQLLYSLGKAVPALSFNHPSSAFLGAVDRCGLRRELLNSRDGL